MILTIDGPTASGKSTVAARLAQQLGYTYINSGLLFRALAYLTTQGIIRYDDQFTHQAEQFFKDKIICYTYEGNQAYIWYQNSDITPLLKTAPIDKEASVLAQYPEVRSLITTIVRLLASDQDVIIDGRDCGTVMFPNASYKFYLTANLQTRADRWQVDQARKGMNYTHEESMRIIDERDTRDTQRAIAPLAIPQNAILIDSTSLSLEQVIDLCLHYISR